MLPSSVITSRFTDDGSLQPCCSKKILAPCRFILLKFKFDYAVKLGWLVIVGLASVLSDLVLLSGAATPDQGYNAVASTWHLDQHTPIALLSISFLFQVGVA